MDFLIAKMVLMNLVDVNNSVLDITFVKTNIVYWIPHQIPPDAMDLLNAQMEVMKWTAPLVLLFNIYYTHLYFL